MNVVHESVRTSPHTTSAATQPKRQPESTDPVSAGTPEERHVIDGLRNGFVPRWLRTSAAVGWRLLVVAAAGLAAFYALTRLQVIVIPLILALLIAAVLAPPARWLRRRGLPPLAATWAVILVANVLIAAAAWMLVPPLMASFGDVGTALGEAYTGVREWLVDGPVGIEQGTLDEMETRVMQRFRSSAETDFAARASVMFEIIAAFFLTLVISFFYIKDGDCFRDRLIGLLPQHDRERARSALADGWSVLQRYLLGVVVVGLADAVLIGIGLMLVGVPHVIPLMALTFLAAFFPMIGAILAGLIAALIALSSGGLTDALLVLGITIAVQQIDGDVIAPLVYSRAVNLHPLSVLLALTAGAVLGGIVGAFLAVPVLAVGIAVARAWRCSAEDETTVENNGRVVAAAPA